MKKVLLSTCVGLTVLCSINSAHAIDAKYRAKLERSGCTQVSEMQGCDINKTKAENAKAGFGTTTSTPSGHSAFAGQWVAKNISTGQTVSNIRVDSHDKVWVDGKQVHAKKSEGGLMFKQGFISYILYADSANIGSSSWYDSDAQTSGSVRKK